MKIWRSTQLVALLVTFPAERPLQPGSDLATQDCHLENINNQTASSFLMQSGVQDKDHKRN